MLMRKFVSMRKFVAFSFVHSNRFRCRVLYNYVPQNPDELEIHVGDIITIVEMCDDGWFCGLMENSKYTKKMEFGTFPGNYVELLPEEN